MERAPHDAALRARLIASARAHPDAIAVDDGTDALSYRELHRRADALAQVLLAAGAGPERTVAVRVGRRCDLLLALWAVLYTGAAFVPVDPTDPVARQRAIVADSGARLVLDAGEGPPLTDVAVPRLAVHTRPAPGTPRLALPALHPENLAYVIYTSGSTGTPKGVAIPHRALVAYLDWAAERYRAGGAALVATSPAFDLTVTGLFAPSLRGGTVRLVAGDGTAALAALLAARSWSMLKLTPSHLDVLGSWWSVERDRPPAVDMLVIGGEALHLRQVRRWLADGWAAEAVNEYGPTETTVGCCVHPVGGGDPEAVPIGHPVPYATAEVLVDNVLTKADGVPAEVGVRGELAVGGTGVGRGYLGRPGLTADRFRPAPGVDGGRWYRTGDLASRDRLGVLRYHGRIDRQLKIRGHRVEPDEVAAVLRTAPGVHDAAVCGQHHTGRVRLVAYAVVRPGTTVEQRALRDHLARQLPDHCLPSRLYIVTALPLTPNGKVDYQRLAQAPPDDARLDALRAVESLTDDEVERLLAATRPPTG
ncbi:amino acid adenylation domain-containing protein [Micromonospora lutea]|uniref:amino acid adenylation domain-containing protein n=1 Tax=Micromonospora lutea TaxID=419825 RepID=UPI00194F72D2|nr:amino acid adenylation domain-containing protein [Micromonospora lutea]